MIRRTITLKAKAAFKTKYQSLLKKDWSDDTARQVLKLLEEQLQASGAGFLFPGKGSGKAPPKRNEITVGPDLLDGLLRLLAPLRLPQLPALPAAADELARNAGTGPAGLAVRSSLYLAFQAMFDIRGEAGFFRDVQSLLYLNVVDSLLPELRSAALAQEHDLLVNAMGYHATVVWRDDAAHQQYLLSILAHYIGDRELEGSSLLASFRLTDPEEHDYMTLAQCYWSYLLENQQYDDAETFLLGVYRRAPRESLAEIREMIDDTFAERAPLASSR
jgi:hypothetical protein